MILLIVIVVVTLVSLILQYRADYLITSTKTSKKIAFRAIVLSFLVFAITSYIQFNDGNHLAENIVTIKNELSDTIHERDNINSKLDFANGKLKVISEQIKPFLILATKKYPRIDSTVALKKLYNEIEIVKKQVHQVSIQDTFLPLESDIKTTLVKDLQFSQLLKNTSVLIEDWTGINTNRQFVQELVDILKEAGISASKIEAMGIQGGYSPPPIEINVIPENRALFEEFIELTKMIFFDFKPQIRPKRDMPDNLIRLRIFGRPRFNEKGQVCYY